MNDEEDERPTTNDQRPTIGLVTLSPCHLVTLSPCHFVTLSPCHSTAKRWKLKSNESTFQPTPSPPARPRRMGRTSGTRLRWWLLNRRPATPAASGSPTPTQPRRD